MPSRWTLRPANHPDLSAVIDLWRRAEVTPPGPTDTIEGLSRLIREPCALLLVATADEQVVGSIIGGWDGWRGNIYRLAVAPEYRRRGLARVLVTEITRTLFDKGAQRISALVEYEHSWATGFWDAARVLGYKRDPQFVRYILDRDDA